MPGRFVLGHYIPEFPHSPHSKYYAMLAEKAAMSTYRFTSKTDLNVELYYLQMREHVLPGKISLAINLNQNVSLNGCKIYYFCLQWKRHTLIHYAG